MQQTLIQMKIFRSIWTPKLSGKTMIIIILIIHLIAVTWRLSALLFNPSVIPPPLLDILCVAKQYLAKTLLTSRECICCKATISVLKNPKIRRRKEQLGGCGDFGDTTLFSCDSFGWSRAGCNVSVYLYSVSVCIWPVYPLLTTFFLFRPSLCYVHLSWWQWCL